MPTLSGHFMSLSGRTIAVNEGNELVLLPREKQPGEMNRLRADRAFWLCRDDGMVGNFGRPSKAVLRLGGLLYHVWLEPRGFSNGANEYGLVVIAPPAEGKTEREYSNQFLAVDDECDQLKVVGSWSAEAKFRCLE